MKIGKVKTKEKFGAGLEARNMTAAGVKTRGDWAVRLVRGGEVQWTEIIKNTTTTSAHDYALDVCLKNGTSETAWYVGLIQTGATIASADTMASHAGWGEFIAYTGATRPTWTAGSISAGSVDNSASKASFGINAATAVGGAFLVAQNTKSGITGSLYALGAFTGGDRTGLQSDDTLEVTATFTAADDA
jgi:hypothetical protein